MIIRFGYHSLMHGLRGVEYTLNNIKQIKQTKKLIMKPKTYILKKDIFFAKAGDEFIETGTNSMSYLHKQTWCQLSVDVIENNPVLFKLKEEELVVDSFLLQESWPKIHTHMYTFRSSHLFTDSQIELIKKAIQKIVNDD